MQRIHINLVMSMDTKAISHKRPWLTVILEQLRGVVRHDMNPQTTVSQNTMTGTLILFWSMKCRHSPGDKVLKGSRSVCCFGER